MNIVISTLIFYYYITIILYPEWPHRQLRWLHRILKLQDRFAVELRLHRFIQSTRRSGGTAHGGGGYDQSVESTVSDAIVRSWLWSTVTGSSPLGYFSSITASG